MSNVPAVPPLRSVVGADLTDRSEAALNCGAALTAAGNGTLVLLHVVSDDLPQPLRVQHEARAKEALSAYAQRARGKGAANIEQHIAAGREYEEILEQAKASKADVIVLGRHRPSSVLQDMLGTTADRLLRFSSTPILLARNADAAPYKNVLVAVDFSAASRRALRLAIRWFPGAQISAVHAFGTPRRLFTDPQARKSIAETHRLALKGFIEEAGKVLPGEYAATVQRITPVVEHGWAENVILQWADANKPDLIVLGTHARTALEHALLGSVAEVVLLEAKSDVLAVPPAI